MKKKNVKILSTLLIISWLIGAHQAFAIANVLAISQRTPEDDGYTSRILEFSADGLVGYDKTAERPTQIYYGAGLSWNSSTKILSATGTGTVTSIGIASSDLSISGSPVTTSGNITANLATTGVSTGTYEKVTVDTKGRVTAGVNPSDSYPARSLNSCFQICSTRSAFVNYSIDIAATISLTTGQTGTVFLETYSDSGCTTGTQEITRFVNGNTGTLTVGLNLTQNVTGTITGYVPAGKYVKIRTANTSGTPTFTYRSGQEVQW